MVKIFFIAFAVAVISLTGFTPVEARGGCGAGRHHGPLGVCVDNAAAPVVVAPRAAVVATPAGRACPLGWHLGPAGHCRRN